jgi:diguanylate cyclase (GGDEF)-like protein
MEGVELKEIISDKVAEALDDYLEYDDEADDLDVVLGRVREFRLRHYNGEEILMAIRIFREIARDQNQWFRVLLKDERRQIQDESLMDIIRTNLQGRLSLDEATGLPDRESCGEYIALVQQYVKTHNLKACFAVIGMDRFDKTLANYGQSGCLTLLNHVAATCKSKFREDDIVCRLSDRTLGLILMDVDVESVRVVLNRLRWFISSHRLVFGGKPNFSVTVSITFADIKGDEDTMLEGCEQAVLDIPAETRNQLIEVKDL